MRKRYLAMLLVIVMVMSLCPAIPVFAADGQSGPVESVYGFLTENAEIVDGSKLSVTMVKVGESSPETYVTEPITAHNDLTDTDYIEMLANECKAGSFCELLYQDGVIVDVHQVLDTNASFDRRSGEMTEKLGVIGFDTAQYGGDLTNEEGMSGRMVAQGWIYGFDSGERTILVGDGNHVTDVFDETYKLDGDVVIRLIDDSYGTAGTIGYDELDGYITETDDNGDIYMTKERYVAVCIFADDYNTDYSDSVVEELYIYETPYQQDDDYLYVPDDAPNHSDYRDNNDAFNKDHMPESHPEMTSAIPFCLMKDRLYWIGDDEVTVLLMVEDKGNGEYDLTVMDLGWPPSGYQYMKNIEKLGFDPRDVKTLALTHGHADHYGAANDFTDMVERAGGEVKVYESKEDTLGYGPEFTDDNGDMWDIAGALTDDTARYIIDEFFPEKEWFNINSDGSIRMYAYINNGHSTGALSFVIRVEPSADDEFFEEDDVVEFSYMGGYGSVTSLSRGYLRNQFQYSLQYLQSYIVPMMDAEADYIYCIPQHTNHYPIVEVSKAWRNINEGKEPGDSGYVPLMACMSEGADTIINQLEKRFASSVYEDYFQAWKNDTREIEYATDPLHGKTTGSSANNQTNEVYGPFKRDDGEYVVQVLSDTSSDVGTILHGYNAWQNPSEYFKGLTNIDGEDLSKGFVIEKDAYVHDPDHWYVQLCVHVMDGYTGNIQDGTYTAEDGTEISYSGGPVESLQGDGWFEVIRTERLDSYEEAKALLDTIEQNGYYVVNLDKSSEIQIADVPAETFVKTDIPFSDAVGHWAEDAIAFAYSGGLMNGVSGYEFSPDTATTRGMIVTMLYRLEGEPAVTAECPFDDVAGSAYYHDAVVWASANGIVNGVGETEFAPNANITREQLAAMMYNYAEYKEIDVSASAELDAFADAGDISGYAADALAWAVAEGLVNGVDDENMQPQGTATRAQVATIFQRGAALWDRGVIVKGFTALNNPVQKVVALSIEYPENVAAPSVDDYSIVDYENQYYYSENERCDSATANITAVYTNDKPELREDKTSVEGRYVIIELEDPAEAVYNEDDGLWHTYYAGVANVRYAEGAKEGVDVTASMIRTDWSNYVVTQEADVLNRNGDVVAEAGVLPSLRASELTDLTGVDEFVDVDFTSSRGNPVYGKLYVPADYDESREYPLVVEVSGGSQRLEFDEDGNPINYGTNLTRDTGAVGWLKVTDDIIILSVQPQKNPPYADTYDEYEDTYELIQHLMDTYSIDSGRIYGIGSSYGTLHLSTVIGNHPDLFTAYVQCNGNFNGAQNMYVDEADVPGADYTDESLIKPDSEYYEEYKAALQGVVDNEVIIWVCHGRNDDTAPITRGVTTYRMLERMYEEEGKTQSEIDDLVRMTIYEDEDMLAKGIFKYHDALRMASADTELMGWILDQSK